MPPPLPRASLIKVPRQQRSIEMVHGILDAAVVVLQRDGVARFTTNYLAATAGVSVGSIYQYFANRDMIIAGVIERGVIDVEQQLRAAVGRARTLPLGEVARQVVDQLLQQLEPYRDVLFEVLSATPVLSSTGLAATLETRFSDAVRDFLVQNTDRYTLNGGLPALYVTVNGLTFVALKWLAERPAHVCRAELVETFGTHFDQLLAARN